MKLIAYVTWELRDKHGQLRSFTKLPANSIVRAFIDHIHPLMQQLAVANGAVDTSGATQTANLGSSSFRCEAALNDGTYGLVVGTGTGAVALTNYALGTKIYEQRNYCSWY